MYDPEKAHYMSATAILVKDNKFLIAKRADNLKSFPGQWTVPGGKLEKKDYINQPKDTSVHWYNLFERVVKREVKEEVGVNVNNIQYLTSLAFIRNDNIPVIIMSYYAEDHEGEIKLNPELTEYAWATLEEAKKYPLIEGIYEELEMLDNILKGKEHKEWKKSE